MNTARSSVTPTNSRDGDPRTADPHAADHRAVEHLRSRTAELGPCTRLHDAVLAFDDLLHTASRHGVVGHPDVLNSLGAVVDTITSSISGRDVVGDPAQPGGPIGPVLLDRAAARFSTRVVGTEIGRRPCPPSVLTALRSARHSLDAAGARSSIHAAAPPANHGDVDTSSVVDVVVLGLLRDRSRIEPVLQALAPIRPSAVRLVGTPLPRPSHGTRELLDLEWGPSHSSSPTARPGRPDVRVAGAHLTWITQMLGEAGHHVTSTDIFTAPLPDMAGRGRVVVIGSGIVGTVRAVLLRRRLLRAGATVMRVGRNRPLGRRGAVMVAE